MAGEKRTFKKKKILSGVRTEYRAWKEWDEDDRIVCKLVGSTPNRKAKTKKDWLVEVIEAEFADRKEQKRVIGKTLTLNCAGMLDKGMNQIELGDIIEVTYNGSKEMEGGDYAGEMAHTMSVVQVEEDDGDEEEVDEDADESSEDDEDEEDDL